MFTFMSDEEHADFLEQERKEKLLQSLNTTTFSLAKLKKPEEPKKEEEIQVDHKRREEANKQLEELAKAYKLDNDNLDIRGSLDEDRWDRMVEDFEIIMDPFNDISTKEQYKYKDRGDDSDEDYYDKRFSKEYSLLHALLGQVEKDSKAVNSKIKEMIASKKPGIGKYSVVDLWNTANSMHSTKLQTIKEIANIKKLASELKLKELKNNPPDSNNIENSASNYYNSILKGGRQNFVNALTQAEVTSRPGLNIPGDDVIIPDDYDAPTSTSITRPLNITRDGYDDVDDSDYTTTYIETENDKVQIYVQRFDDGELEFCALDENGRDVPGYPLPDPSLLNTLNTRPDSNYTFDSYGRKYKIIDFGTSFDEVDVSVNEDNEDDYY